MSEHLTVGKIAERLKRKNESHASAVDRIRNWTKAGLLKPAIRNRGTGRANLYPKKEADRAEVIESMARIGMSVEGRTRLINRIGKRTDLQNAIAKLADACRAPEAVS